MRNWSTGMKFSYLSLEFILLLLCTAMGLALITDPHTNVTLAGGLAAVAGSLLVFWFVSIIFYIMLDD